MDEFVALALLVLAFPVIAIVALVMVINTRTALRQLEARLAALETGKRETPSEPEYVYVPPPAAPQAVPQEVPAPVAPVETPTTMAGAPSASAEAPTAEPLRKSLRLTRFDMV